VHQALYLGAKHHGSLVNPNQLRQHGLAVDDCPCQFDPQSKHAIFVPESNVSIPLHLEGIISYFESFAPTDDDMEALPRVELTCAEDWEPYSIAFTEKEEEARRRASVAKWRIESQIEVDVAKRSEQRLYPLDFNMESAMDVCVNHGDTIDSYLEHIHTNSLELSGENLYKRMVKCVKVTTDDSDSNSLKEDQDMDNDDSNVADRKVLVLTARINDQS
jgi:hypothetical protein